MANAIGDGWFGGGGYLSWEIGERSKEKRSSIWRLHCGHVESVNKPRMTRRGSGVHIWRHKLGSNVSPLDLASLVHCLESMPRHFCCSDCTARKSPSGVMKTFCFYEDKMPPLPNISDGHFKVFTHCIVKCRVIYHFWHRKHKHDSLKTWNIDWCRHLSDGIETRVLFPGLQALCETNPCLNFPQAAGIPAGLDSCRNLGKIMETVTRPRFRILVGGWGLKTRQGQIL